MSWRVGVVFDDDFLELIHDYVPMYKEGGGAGGIVKAVTWALFLCTTHARAPGTNQRRVRIFLFYLLTSN